MQDACDNQVCYVKLGKVLDCGTCVRLVNPFMEQIFDLLPMIQAGETDTSLELLPEARQLCYYPEEFTRTNGQKGKRCNICISDIAALMKLQEIGDVEDKDPGTGDTIVYNSVTKQYELFNLTAKFNDIENQIKDNNDLVTNHTNKYEQTLKEINKQTARINELYELYASLKDTVTGIEKRLLAIESAIYNWANDKTTKIPRGTINITSGGRQSNWIIQSRAKDQNEDLNFE